MKADAARWVRASEVRKRLITNLLLRYMRCRGPDAGRLGYVGCIHRTRIFHGSMTSAVEIYTSRLAALSSRPCRSVYQRRNPEPILQTQSRLCDALILCLVTCHGPSAPTANVHVRACNGWAYQSPRSIMPVILPPENEESRHDWAGSTSPATTWRVGNKPCCNNGRHRYLTQHRSTLGAVLDGKVASLEDALP